MGRTAWSSLPGSGLALPALLAASLAGAQPVPGDVYATEFQAGTVVRVSGPGDLAGAPRFASGLDGPYGLCVGPGGDLYVAEFLSGELTAVTPGGDLTGAPPFAWGLSGPFGLSCSASEILVTEMASGEVTDATAGGDLSGAPPLATVPGQATGLLRDSAGRLFVAADGLVYEVSAGGSFDPGDAFAGNGDAPRALAEHGGRLYLADVGAHAVIDFTAGGDLATLPVFAELLFVAGLLDLGDRGLLAASDGLDGLWNVASGGDFATVPPDVSGVGVEFFAGLALVDTCGDGVLQPAEECDDGNTVDGDGCASSCRVQLCAIPPATGCMAARRPRLRVDASRPGRERLDARLGRLEQATAAADFGDPVGGATRADLCVYDEADTLVAELRVDEAGALCGSKAKPCWKAMGSRGFAYRDPESASDGVRRLRLRSGGARRGRVRLAARNHALRLQSALPAGIAPALAGSASARLQLVTSDGGCFEGALANVRRSDAEGFLGKGP